MEGDRARFICFKMHHKKVLIQIGITIPVEKTMRRLCIAIIFLNIFFSANIPMFIIIYYLEKLTRSEKGLKTAWAIETVSYCHYF